MDNTDALAEPDRDFLEAAISDYNNMFGTSFDTSPDRFQNYYKDVSLRMRNRELDLLIVVNMFLTGFDATTLNTLWVDKNLRMHGFLQAFSRTNRIFNSVKTFGNIICFRNLQAEVDESISVFSDEDVSSIVLLKDFNDYIVFEIELARQIEINMDYILALIEKYHDSNCKDREICIRIRKAVESSMQLHSKEELIENFLGVFEPSSDVMESWHAHVEAEKEKELSEIIATEKLKDAETRRFVRDSFESGQVKTTGTDIDELMLKTSRFFGGNRDEKRRGIIGRLLAFFEKFFGIASSDMNSYPSHDSQDVVSAGESDSDLMKVAEDADGGYAGESDDGVKA